MENVRFSSLLQHVKGFCVQQFTTAFEQLNVENTWVSFPRYAVITAVNRSVSLFRYDTVYCCRYFRRW
jgi:hypothetical protein